MAGEALQKIYCWQLTVDALNIFLASSDRGALGICLSLDEHNSPLDFFTKKIPKARLVMDKKANTLLVEAVGACLCNKYLKSIPPLDISFTPFEKGVYSAISKIPFGETRRYGEIASIIGRPGGARAVGQAMKRNPLPLIFP